MSLELDSSWKPDFVYVFLELDSSWKLDFDKDYETPANAERNDRKPRPSIKKKVTLITRSRRRTSYDHAFPEES